MKSKQLANFLKQTVPSQNADAWTNTKNTPNEKQRTPFTMVQLFARKK